AGVTSIVCAANLLIFTAAPQAWDRVFILTGYSAHQIRDHDNEVEHIVRAIREQLPADDTVILHALEYLPLGLRHLQLHLPEYEQYQLAIDRALPLPVDRPLIHIVNGRLEFAARPQSGAKRKLALIVPSGASLESYAPHVTADIANARPLPGSDGHVFVM